MTKVQFKNIVASILSLLVTTAAVAADQPSVTTDIGHSTLSAATKKRLSDIVDRCLKAEMDYQVHPSCINEMSFTFLNSGDSASYQYQGWIMDAGQVYSISLLLAQYSAPLSAGSDYKPKNGDSLVVRANDGTLVGRYLNVNTHRFNPRQSLLDLLR